MEYESDYNDELNQIAEEPLCKLVIAALVLLVLYVSILVIEKVRLLWNWL